MPIMKIGRNETRGCVLSMSPRAPSVKIAEVTPNVATTDRRNPRAAVSGTRIERNAISNRRNASPTTMARYFGSALLFSSSEMSISMAVLPATPRSTPSARSVPESPLGRARSFSTRSLVSWSFGPAFGVTMTCAARLSGARPAICAFATRPDMVGSLLIFSTICPYALSR
ncbi:hypothetical protein MTP03_45510 [Tsukamurella sp. PLM1]|nr:hypothetical protein MTP03_45510 [Tsukamurella sp. PLM1]